MTDQVPKENEMKAPEGIGSIPRQMDFMQFLIGAVIVVLLVGLVGTLVAIGISWEASTAEKQATYEDLKDKIIEQDNLIQSQDTELNTLTTKINYVIYQQQQFKSSTGN